MTLQLEVGKTYVNREGEKVEITDMRAATAYRYMGSHGVCYTADGRFDLDQPGHGFDLIEECEPDSLAELTERQKELDAYFCGSEYPPKASLCEVITNEFTDEVKKLPDGPFGAGAAWGFGLALGIVHRHVAALSVEEVAKALCGWRNGKRSAVPFGDLSEAEKAAYCDQAQAVMNLLKKD